MILLGPERLLALCQGRDISGGHGLGELADAFGRDDEQLLRLPLCLGITVQLDQIGDDGVWLALAVDEGATPSGGEVCVGKGWTAAEAVRGCLGELAELRSWIARGDEPVEGEADTATAAAWVELVEIRGARRLRWPAARIYGHAPAAWSGSASRLMSSSNGCAAGPTWESAVRSGLREVVERDAASLWWQLGLARPAIPPAATGARALSRALRVRAVRGRPAWLLDLTHDLGLHVAAAISVERDGRLPAIGFGCDVSRAVAAERAYLEMRQAEVNLALCRQRWEGRAVTSLAADERRLRAWLETASASRLPWLLPQGTAEPGVGRPTDVFASCLPELARRGLAAFVADLTRPDIGIPVARVVVPGLGAPGEPLPAGRLRDARALGWHVGEGSPADHGVPFPP